MIVLGTRLEGNLSRHSFQQTFDCCGSCWRFLRDRLFSPTKGLLSKFFNKLLKHLTLTIATKSQ